MWNFYSKELILLKIRSVYFSKRTKNNSFIFRGSLRYDRQPSFGRTMNSNRRLRTKWERHKDRFHKIQLMKPSKQSNTKRLWLNPIITKSCQLSRIRYYSIVALRFRSRVVSSSLQWKISWECLEDLRWIMKLVKR